jgi:hypothetical protein
MRTKSILWLATLLLAASQASARLARGWTWEEMCDQADLVVIARPTATKDTSEHSKLLETIPVIGVHTEFETRLVLKGSHALTSFTLHHYRFASIKEEETTANGPNLLRIRIQPFRLHTFLLFLRREKSGIYVPVTDQIDPDVSVIELQTAAL